MLFADQLVLDAPRRTAEGYLAVRAKAARTGVYQYTGREVDPDNTHGLRDQAIVNVLRDEGTVFDKRAARSFIGKPITTGHPAEPVNSKNWKQHADGVIMGALRDGEHLAFDLLLMDEAAIADTAAGTVELSNGYGARIEFGDFKAPDGTICQARQAEITDGNHVARVKFGRAGSTCRIGDAAVCDALPSNILDSLTKTEKPVKTIMIDGLTVDVSNADTAMATITTLIAARDAATGKVTGLEAKSVADAATIVAKDAEIAKLTADVAAAKPTLQQLRDAGKQFAVIEGKAKAMGVTVTDAMDEAAIMKAVVDKAMGATAKDYTADHVAIAFEALTKDAKVADAAVQPLGSPVVIGDSRQMRDAARQDYIASLTGQKKEAA
ncbi:DUF2213 domain-containing protein [Sphingobium sp. ba1]|jgi:hypothetical protein|uniref:DUF2213 domain-containing protein n=1 Tax=Sphingobium sp. ba1 TaxID=1522072 RepID=UPI00069099B7|nr:DUF2213 domain-containing protein [Sphingobium sp. ba1]